jgi:hypothetical protein
LIPHLQILPKEFEAEPTRQASRLEQARRAFAAAHGPAAREALARRAAALASGNAVAASVASEEMAVLVEYYAPLLEPGLGATIAAFDRERQANGVLTGQAHRQTMVSASQKLVAALGRLAPANETFSALLRRDSLAAEQVLTVRVPSGSDPIHRLGRLFKPLGMTGMLPEAFTPAAAQTLTIPSSLIGEFDADLITIAGRVDPAVEKVLRQEVNGEQYVRKLEHPLRAPSKRAEKPDISDPLVWRGTPTSSSRSLLVSDQEGRLGPIVAKTSLSYVLAGVKRQVSRAQARLAVQVSAFYDDIMAHTGGRIPNTSKTWRHFKESAAVGRKGEDSDFTIMRTLPSDYAETTYIPFYALIADRGDGRRWIDELYAASGYRDRLEFVWREIAKPLLEFHLLVNLDYGIVTELHQQNALVRIDPGTHRILGFAARDMDGHSIDYIARKHRLGLPLPPGGLNSETSRTYGYSFSWGMPMLGYEYIKDSLFKHVMKFFLEPRDVRRLVGLGNEMMRARVSAHLAPLIGETKNYLELTEAFHRTYAKVLTTEEAAFFRTEHDAFKASRSWLVNAFKGMIFTYYRFKQRFERAELPHDRRFTEPSRISALLDSIREEGRAVVPQRALDYWLHLQQRGATTMDTKVALDAGTEETLTRISAALPEAETALRTSVAQALQRRELSARELRSIVMEHLAAVEDPLHRLGATRKTKADFIDEGRILAELYDGTSPHWYTFEPLDVDAFVRLSPLPLHPIGLEHVVRVADGYEMPPVEFAHHDELHALGRLAGERDRLLRKGMLPGTEDFYRDVLERVRFTKRFLAWTGGLPTADQEIVKALWFDAFHEYFPKKWPLYRYHHNLPASLENLRYYASLHMNSAGSLRPYKRLERAFGLGTFRRLGPRFNSDQVVYGLGLVSRFVFETELSANRPGPMPRQ